MRVRSRSKCIVESKCAAWPRKRRLFDEEFLNVTIKQSQGLRIIIICAMESVVKNKSQLRTQFVFSRPILWEPLYIGVGLFGPLAKSFNSTSYFWRNCITQAPRHLMRCRLSSEQVFRMTVLCCRTLKLAFLSFRIMHSVILYTRLWCIEASWVQAFDTWFDSHSFPCPPYSTTVLFSCISILRGYCMVRSPTIGKA